MNEECTPSDFSTSTADCPPPDIASVQPNRGPVSGGTRVTITGSNLGTAFDDIVDVRLRSGSDTVDCSLAGERDSYITGLEIVCETEAADSAGEYSLEVEVARESETVVASAPFLVEQPVVSGVDPRFAPKSGGIVVVISGSNLDTGNTNEITVELNGVNCVITL